MIARMGHRIEVITVTAVGMGVPLREIFSTLVIQKIAKAYLPYECF